MSHNPHNQPVFIQSGDPETENVSALEHPGSLGVRTSTRQPSTPGAPGTEERRFKTYQRVKTDSTMSVAPYKGAVAWWADRASYLVTTDATNRNDVAGVFQGVITPGNYGWVQQRGPATVKFVDASMAALAAGDMAIPSTTDGKAQRVAAGTAPTHTKIGTVAVNLEKDAAGATAIVDLDVPETP